MRADRAWAFVAFLLTATALLLPWWRLAYEADGVGSVEDFRTFRPREPATTTWGPWLTGVLAAAAAGLLFVRLAADSHEHEPASWRRDLVVACALLAAALLSCLLWPADVPWFWGGRTYHDPAIEGPPTTETAMPGLGWWVAVAALAAAALASWKARRAADGSTDGGATTK
jgi:hypothetical protein